MFSLVFIVCMAGGQCITVAPEGVFATVGECEFAADMIITENRQRVLQGTLPEHAQQFSCVSWGEPV